MWRAHWPLHKIFTLQDIDSIWLNHTQVQHVTQDIINKVKQKKNDVKHVLSCGETVFFNFWGFFQMFRWLFLSIYCLYRKSLIYFFVQAKKTSSAQNSLPEWFLKYTQVIFVFIFHVTQHMRNFFMLFFLDPKCQGLNAASGFFSVYVCVFLCISWL